MKLYIFETCPFCARARIMAGLKGLTPELVGVAPGMIPAELGGRIEKLTVPIFVDGELLIQDSTKTVRHFDTVGDQLLPSYGTSLEMDAWRKQMNTSLNALCYPRMPYLNVPELEPASAREFFEYEMPKRIGMPLAQALSETDRFVTDIQNALPALLPFLDEDNISFDTLAALAELRSLSMVAELTFPSDITGPFTHLMDRAGTQSLTPITSAGTPL